MATEAKTTNYWISNSALYIQLNATGEPNRIQASVVSGASILCYMQGIDGLGYDAGHNYQRWTLAAYPSEFPSDEKRYVYVAIPRKRTSDNDIATIVFPSQKIDIYGKAIVLKTDEDGKQEEVVGDQIGSEDYYYIYLQGIISEVYLNEANDRIRRWVQDVDFGSLSTDEALASGGVAQWWKYNSVSDTITFLKTILSATFESLVAKTISVTTLFFGKEKKITGIASDESKEDSEEVIVTPKYGNRNYLSKTKDDTAEGLITFAKGLITDAIKSLDYDNAAEQGFSVEKEKNGKYHAFFTNLTIWGKAIFHELEVRKLSYSGGNIYLSGAGSKLIKVVPVKKSVSDGGVTSWVETTDNDVECVGWKCYLLADNGTTATMNYWQDGDQVRCQTMGEIVSGGTYQNASNKSYWRTIPDGGVSTQNEKIYGSKTETYLDEDGNEQTRKVQVELYDGQAFAWIVVGKHCGDIDGYDDEFSVGYNGSNPAPLETRDIPSAGDTIVLDGNRHRNEQQEYDKTDRQNVIILETTGEYAPRIACYANISEYKHTITKRVNGSDKEVSLSVFETSPKGGTKINSSRFEWISDDGSTINIINYRGDWVSTNIYHKNDQVNHNNAVWVCVANSGVDVSEEPLDGATYWKKVLSGGKGEKGDKGDNAIRLALTNENSSVSCDKNGNPLGTVQGTIAILYDGAVAANADRVTYSIVSYDGLSVVPEINAGGAIDNIEIRGGNTSLKASINIKAVYENQAYYATYTITKVLAGSDGTPAISYWIEPSATAIKVDSDGNANPSTITCKQYKQVGAESPVSGDKKIYYRHSTMASILWNEYTEAINPATNVESYEFALADKMPSNNNAIVYDRETIPVVKDGSNGDDAVSYSVSLMKSFRTIAGHSDQSAVTVSFRKQEGSKSTVSGNIAAFGDSASVKCYIDGERSDNMTDWINSGNDYFGYLNYEDAWTGKSVITVVMYIGNNIVASANFSLGQSGEGVVMAYKNATSRPSKPTVEDLSQLSDGWSRTPQKGGSYLKVDNISYGSFDNGDSSSVDSTSKSWTDVTESGNSWKKSPSGLSDNYGWTIMKVSFTTNVDNSDVKVTIKAYSEGNYDFIQVHALDTEITGSSSLRKTGVAYISGNGIETSYSYHVTTAGQHFFYVSYCKDSSGHSNGDYGLFRFDLSDNLVSMPSTVWMSQAVLKDGKAVLPWSTPVQITGDDAYRVEVSPSTLVFDTNENGVVDGTALSGKYATVTVYKGSQKISADNLSLPSNYATKKYTNVDGRIYNTNGEARITITKIEQETISGDEKVSKSSGQISFPIDVFGERSTLMWVTVNVQVNVAKFTGSVAFDNKRYKAQFDELSKGGGAATKNELTQATSTFEQTARKISLSVSEKSVGRRNMLVGSAFQRDDNNWSLSSDTRIEMNTGYQGTNCIRIIDDTTDGKTRYLGVFWDGSQGGKSVKITKGKKYVISCWYFSNDANGHLSLEALYTDKQMNAERKGAPKYLSAGSLVPKPNQWQLFTTVIDTTDAEYDYIAFNFYEYCGINSGLIQAYICRPMVEEGDTYNGWTLSQNDYDVIGANLIDNSRTLDAGGNVLEVKGRKALVGDAYELTYRGSDDYNTFYRIKGSTFKLGVDYTISFEVRGDAKYMGMYAYYPITNTKFTFYAEPQNGAMTEVTDGGKVDNYVTLIQVEELSKQQRVWSHFRFKDRLPEYIYFQFPKNAEQTGVTSWSVTITRPKIEVGAVVTEYTERKSDLVDKASLKAAGIVVDSESVTLYGNQVHIKKNKTDANDTVLIDNETGQVSAGLINADEVVAKGIKTQELEAQHLKVTGNSQLGIFEIHTAEKDDRDQYTISGDSIQYSGGYKFPDGKTDAYGAGSFLMYKPMFVRQGSPDDNIYMRLGYQFTEWDDGNISGGNKNYFFVGAAARYVCSGDTNSCSRTALPVDLKYSLSYSELKPAAYIYSVKTLQDDPAFAIKVVKPEDSSGERTAIQTNAAIRGVFAPNAADIYKDRQIPNGVGVVYCSNDSDMTLTLPDSPVDGQTLIIIQGSSGKVYIVPPNGKEIHFGGSIKHSSDIGNNRFWSGTRGQFNILVFINDAWQLQFMNNRP